MLLSNVSLCRAIVTAAVPRVADACRHAPAAPSSRRSGQVPALPPRACRTPLANGRDSLHVAHALLRVPGPAVLRGTGRFDESACHTIRPRYTDDDAARTPRPVMASVL